MAASDWLASELISSLKRRGSIPTSGESWTEADFRAYANDSMRGYILPLLRRLNEEFFVTTFDTTLTAGTASYRISYRALGEALRDVMLSDGSGGYFSLPRKNPHDVSDYLSQTSGKPTAFYLQDDAIVLTPTPSAADTLRVKCMVRPGKLVATSRVYDVTGKTSTTLTVTCLDDSVSTTAATFFGSSATVDVIKAQPGFRHLRIDDAVTISGNTITFASAVLSSVAVGDYVCVAEESPVPQIPAEMHPLLAQDVVCAVLRATNGGGYAEAVAERDRLEGIALGLFSPRTENQPRYVRNDWGVGGPILTRWRR